MLTLSVWLFDDARAATRAADVLADFVRRDRTAVIDAATVTWASGRQLPRVCQLPEPLGGGPAGALYWGALLGVVLLPKLGSAGAPAGALTTIGVPDGLVVEVGEGLQPGTSALLLRVDGTAVGRMHDALAIHRPRLLYANLGPVHDALTREVFGTP